MLEMSANKMSRVESNYNRYQRYKVLKRSPSVQQLREEIRKQFKENLKSGRNREQCKRRDLFKIIMSDVDKHFSEIDQELLQGYDSDLLNTEEVLRMLVEVEQELNHNASQRQVEQYALDLEEEIKSLSQEFAVCSICNRFTELQGNSINIICDKCVNLHFNSDDL